MTPMSYRSSSLDLGRHLGVLLLSACLLLSTAAELHAQSTAAAAQALSQARGLFASRPSRVAHYLQAADEAAQAIDDPDHAEDARQTYNAACTELACLLCSHSSPAQKDHWGVASTWDAGDLRYHLEYAPAAARLRLDPQAFTQLVPADQAGHPHVGQHWKQEGWGGALVAIRRVRDAAGRAKPFAPQEGFTLPTTATLEFSGPPHERVARLTLQDSLFQGAAPLYGGLTPLLTDLSAPLGIHSDGRHVWNGVGELLLGHRHSSFSGLYCFEPPDPKRIPIIFIHGLLLTSYMWQDMINTLEGSAEIRTRYQPYVFRYPTGLPIESNALDFRNALVELQKRHGLREGCVLIGHSMGGLLAQMQSVSTGRRLWDANLKALHLPADQLYRSTPPDSSLKQALCFEANPKIRRIIFICVPHRGTDFANGSVAAIGATLVRIPRGLLSSSDTPYEQALRQLAPHRLGHRTSIDTLSPRNPTFQALNEIPIQAPHHSIMGNRRDDNNPETSSDGVVPYSSSHLDSAESEIVVHGTHDTYGLRDTLEEVKRIMLEDAKQNADPNN